MPDSGELAAWIHGALSTEPGAWWAPWRHGPDPPRALHQHLRAYSAKGPTYVGSLQSPSQPAMGGCTDEEAEAQTLSRAQEQGPMCVQARVGKQASVVPDTLTAASASAQMSSSDHSVQPIPVSCFTLCSTSHCETYYLFYLLTYWSVSPRRMGTLSIYQ